MTSDDVMTVAEAAAYLRVSKRTVYRLFGTGELPRSKVGGRILVRRIDVLGLVLSKKVDAPTSKVLNAVRDVTLMSMAEEIGRRKNRGAKLGTSAQIASKTSTSNGLTELDEDVNKESKST